MSATLAAAIALALFLATPAAAQAIRVAAYQLDLEPGRDFVWRTHPGLHTKGARAALTVVARRLRAPEREIGEITTPPERRPTSRDGHVLDYRVDSGHVLCAAFVAPESSFAEVGACGFSADAGGVSSVTLTSTRCDDNMRLDMISVRADLAGACVGLPDPDDVPRAIGARGYRLYPQPDVPRP